jgi:hypothetical protein
MKLQNSPKQSTRQTILEDGGLCLSAESLATRYLIAQE